MVKKEILKRTVVVSMTLLLAGMFTGCSEEADVTGDTSTEKIVSMSSEEIEEESTEASTEDIESSVESSEEETNQEESSNEDTTVAEGSDEQMVADKGVSNSAEVVETTPVQPVVETPAPTQPAPTQPIQQVVTPVETKPVATQPQTQPATQPQVVETAPVQTQPVTQPQTQPATQPQVVETTPVQTQPVTQPQVLETTPAPTEPVTQPQTQPATQPIQEDWRARLCEEYKNAIPCIKNVVYDMTSNPNITEIEVLLEIRDRQDDYDRGIIDENGNRIVRPDLGGSWVDQEVGGGD